MRKQKDPAYAAASISGHCIVVSCDKDFDQPLYTTGRYKDMSRLSFVCHQSQAQRRIKEEIRTVEFYIKEAGRRGAEGFAIWISEDDTSVRFVLPEKG